ncbi:MAG: hypothetical protein U0183_20925 [Polyangiaceae bacterium]
MSVGSSGIFRPAGWSRRDVPMGLAILGEVLSDWRRYELDDSIYVPLGVEVSNETHVHVLPFDRTRKRVFDGQRYLLGIEQVRDVVEGLGRQLGRATTPTERLRAVLHFVRHDAFIDPREAVGG